MESNDTAPVAQNQSQGIFSYCYNFVSYVTQRVMGYFSPNAGAKPDETPEPTTLLALARDPRAVEILIALMEARARANESTLSAAVRDPRAMEILIALMEARVRANESTLNEDSQLTDPETMEAGVIPNESPFNEDSQLTDPEIIPQTLENQPSAVVGSHVARLMAEWQLAKRTSAGMER